MIKITNRYFILLLLTVAYTFSFMDRYVMNLLLNDVKRDFALTEFQAGLLAGAGFAVLYALMAIPMGIIADRKNRVKLAAVGVAVWSLMTMYCGVAKNFFQLIMGRTGVGIGEATLTPSAYPVIKSLFSAEKLSTALGIYSCGIYLGSGLAYWLGGEVIALIENGQLKVFQSLVSYNWQIVFLLFGIPGLLIALILYFVKMPDTELATQTGYSFPEVKHFLFSNHYYFLKFSLASALFNVAVYAAGVWLPAYLQRVHKLSTSDSGELLGMAMLFVAPIGAIIGGMLGDKYRTNHRIGGRIKSIILSITVVMICFIFLCFNWSKEMMYLPLMALCFVMGMPVAITAAAVQEIASSNIRSFAPAFLLMLQNLIGMSLGPAIVAALTQYLFKNEIFVGTSIAITGITFSLLSLLLFHHLKNHSHE